MGNKYADNLKRQQQKMEKKITAFFPGLHLDTWPSQQTCVVGLYRVEAPSLRPRRGGRGSRNWSENWVSGKDESSGWRRERHPDRLIIDHLLRTPTCISLIKTTEGCVGNSTSRPRIGRIFRGDSQVFYIWQDFVKEPFRLRLGGNEPSGS